MPDSRPDTLRQALAHAAVRDSSVLTDGRRCVALRDLLHASPIGSTRAGLYGRSVLIAVETQYEAAQLVIDLDGCARRLLLLPPDVKDAHLPAIIRDAEIDAIVCSNPAAYQHLGVEAIFACGAGLAPVDATTAPAARTEWLMLTSGTTGDPKIAVHTLAALTGAIPTLGATEQRPIWATFYDIRRYGGLQIFLRAIFAGGSLVLSRPDEAVADHLVRLTGEGVTHVSGTPTHWRRALMSSAVEGFRPDYVRLSGEISDQAILDALREAFPEASIGHAYASTEAGVGFDVNDGMEGFPASYLEAARNGVEMKVIDGSLRIRSSRMASGYAGRPDLAMADEQGWIDTDDMVDLRNGRCYFSGRRGGIINVGGLKVHPEEIETVINRHAAVRLSRVKPRKSPIIGSIVVADVVLLDNTRDPEGAKRDILELCRSNLPAHKIPALVNVVGSIDMTAGGKVSRQHA